MDACCLANVARRDTALDASLKIAPRNHGEIRLGIYGKSLM